MLLIFKVLFEVRKCPVSPYNWHFKDILAKNSFLPYNSVLEYDLQVRYIIAILGESGKNNHDSWLLIYLF